ncbi:unnamed protein product [Allacma fusca]|uniref:Uncharacterized protein n=1 Tax=Allacma fusca TaxID=39272 RepID=A0A8J2NYC1_9HEXA|nr:unnamed protein product [Allacma fusca]
MIASTYANLDLHKLYFLNLLELILTGPPCWLRVLNCDSEIVMAFRARAPLELSKFYTRFNGVNTHSTFKPIVCAHAQPLYASQVGQFRWKSDARFPEITEFVSPETPVATIFSDWAPVLLTQDALYQVHDLSGLAWAPTIVLTTMGLRFLMGLPLAVTQEKSLGRLVNLKPEFQKLGTDLAREVAIAKKLYNWDDKKANFEFKKSFKKHYNKLLVEYNCHPKRALALPILQLPVWLAVSSAIRNIACLLPTNLPDTTEQHYRYMQMAVENPGKVTVPKTTAQKIVPWCFRGIIIGTGLLATYVPAAVSLYWLSSSVAALILNIILKLNPFQPSYLTLTSLEHNYVKCSKGVTNYNSKSLLFALTNCEIKKQQNLVQKIPHRALKQFILCV